MARKTKYCLNLGIPRHLRDANSASGCYCSQCYEEAKIRYSSVEKSGGPVQVLRAARVLAGGSFGYERSKAEKQTNLRAFFATVMPEIPVEEAERLSEKISSQNTCDLVSQNGKIKSIKMYS